MTRTIKGIFRRGVVELTEKIALKDGTVVHVRYNDVVINDVVMQQKASQQLAYGMFRDPPGVVDEVMRALRQSQNDELEREFDEFFPRS